MSYALPAHPHFRPEPKSVLAGNDRLATSRHIRGENRTPHGPRFENRTWRTLAIGGQNENGTLTDIIPYIRSLTKIIDDACVDIGLQIRHRKRIGHVFHGSKQHEPNFAVLRLDPLCGLEIFADAFAE